MDSDRFDRLTKRLGGVVSRRGALGFLAGAAALGGLAGSEAAKDKKKRKAKTKARRPGRGNGAPAGPDRVAAEATCASPGPSSNLSGCNFNGDDFSDDDLSGSRMVETTFRDATLVATNLSSSNMKLADFRRANLCGANLRSSTLKNADFRNADLTNANLASSACGGAKFTGATFCNTRTCTGAVRNDGCPAGVAPEDACCSCGSGETCCGGICQIAWANQATFGGLGTGPGQFRDPFGVAVSADALTVWVADTINQRVSVWTRPTAASTAWTNQTTFGSLGPGPGQFGDPAGVAVSPDGLTVWVADAGNDRVSVWTRPTAASTAWTNQTTFGGPGSGPSQFDEPAGVAVAPDGLTVWVADSANDRVSVWTRPTAASTAWANQATFGGLGSGPGQFDHPRGVAVAPDGLTVWVADADNDRVSVWTRPTAASTAWTNQTTFGSLGPGPGQFDRPLGVAVSPDALTAWVADTTNHRVSVWARPTAASTAWTNQTTFGGGPGDGASQFSFPFGVAVSPDALTVWVADTGNDRVSVWGRGCPV